MLSWVTDAVDKANDPPSSSRWRPKPVMGGLKRIGAARRLLVRIECPHSSKSPRRSLDLPSSSMVIDQNAREATLVNERPQRLWRAVFVRVAILVAAAGCSPLPGSSFDPVYLKSGTQSPQTPTQAPRPSTAPPGRDADVTGPTVWIGRYQDSRGSGDVIFSIVRGITTLSGSWKFRTGGGGPVTGMAEASGRRLQLRMENTAPECPGTFEGWAEITDITFIGGYRGKDCEGAVTDGRFELRRR